MYPWNERSAASSSDTAGPETAGPGSGVPASLSHACPEPAVSAVQVALDRRDNGGDPAAVSGTLPSSPARQ
jgi:hypothetical protein